MRKYVSVFIILFFIALISSAEESRTEISLKPHEERVTIKKVLVTDSRAVRGFLGTPVDGSIHSWDYRGTVREYPKTASDGVVYSYNNNEGRSLAHG